MNARSFRPGATRAGVGQGPAAGSAAGALIYRGPQANPTIAAAPTFHAPNAALLIDFDNVTMGIQKDLHAELKALLGSDIIRGKVAVQRAYADWRRYPAYIVPLAESSIDMIMAPAYGTSKKNATDIRLAVDAMELVFTRPEIGTFILLSGDSDFASLVTKLKEYGKYVIGVGIRESSSDLLVMNCDEYYSYNALAGLVRTSDEEPVRKWDPWELVTEAVGRMKRNGDVMRSDRLKQVMQEIDGSFDEKDAGFAKFSKFCQEAAGRGLLSVTRLENGQLEVDVPTGIATATTTLAPERAGRDGRAPREERDARPDAERGEREEREGREARDERGGRRSRRGRGRGRDRERGEERPDERAARDGARDGAREDQLELAAETPATTTTAPAPRAPRTPTEFGIAGERLTRDEAFDLVRRAVASVTTADEAVRANAVRQAAFGLLGRDSESLSERNFTRILRDAHEADVIDLRRRGDDFEVARADVAPAAATPAPSATPTSTGVAAPPAAPPVRVGMGPRGAATRGRGRPGAPPPELLSIGVVASASGAIAPPPSPASAPAPAVEPSALEASDRAAEQDRERADAARPSTRRGRGRGSRRGRGAAGTAADAAIATAAPAPAPTPVPVPQSKPAAPPPKKSRRGGARSGAVAAAPAPAAREPVVAPAAVATASVSPAPSDSGAASKRGARKSADAGGKSVAKRGRGAAKQSAAKQGAAKQAAAKQPAAKQPAAKQSPVAKREGRPPRVESGAQ